MASRGPPCDGLGGGAVLGAGDEPTGREDADEAAVELEGHLLRRELEDGAADLAEGHCGCL